MTRWIGGANLPTLGGWRINASFGLAELWTQPEQLGIRILLPSRLSRAEELVVGPDEISLLARVETGNRVFGFRGIAVRRPNGREYYFRTGKADQILPVLQSNGFQVSADVLRKTKIWTGRA